MFTLGFDWTVLNHSSVGVAIDQQQGETRPIFPVSYSQGWVVFFFKDCPVYGSIPLTWKASTWCYQASARPKSHFCTSLLRSQDFIQVHNKSFIKSSFVARPSWDQRLHSELLLVSGSSLAALLFTQTNLCSRQSCGCLILSFLLIIINVMLLYGILGYWDIFWNQTFSRTCFDSSSWCSVFRYGDTLRSSSNIPSVGISLKSSSKPSMVSSPSLRRKKRRLKSCRPFQWKRNLRISQQSSTWSWPYLCGTTDDSMIIRNGRRTTQRSASVWRSQQFYLLSLSQINISLTMLMFAFN